METKATRKLIALLGGVLLFMSMSLKAQKEIPIDAVPPPPPPTSIKEWFDSGDIIVDATPEDAVNKYGNCACFKVKINRVLKGGLKAGYFNLKVEFARVRKDGDIIDIDYFDGVTGRIGVKFRYLLKIKKADVSQECYLVENNGVYEKDGDFKLISNSTDEKELYQQLHDYCGIKVDKALLEKKSPNATVTKQENNDLYAQRLQNLERDNEYFKNKKPLRKSNIGQVNNASGCTELFISEYLDGQGNNNAVEIYNPTAASISLSNYKLLLYHSASLTPVTVALTGTISAYSTHVVAQQGASSSITTHANQTTGNLNFNGTVCTVLSKGAIHIDKIGEIGVTNSSGTWTLTPSGGTNNSDIRRQYNISGGDTSWTSCKAEWNVFSEDSVTNLGYHSNICGVDPDLNIGFANPYSVDSSNGKSYFEFDITVASIGASTYLDNSPVRIQYSTAAFGTYLVTNNKVSVVRPSQFNTSTYVDPNLHLSDVSADTINIGFGADYTQSSWSRVLITSTPVTIMRVTIEVQNCNQNTALTYVDGAFMSFLTWYVAGQHDNPNTATDISYTNVNYGSDLNYTIPTSACSSAPQITSIVSGYVSAPNSVIAGAYYNGITYNESQLTINGSGFGTILQPKVLMKNAVAGVTNSSPAYIKLDSIDITSWNDNQIVLNVPSVLLLSNPNPTGYPGTGYIKVVKAGSTDTAVSPNPITIPYALKNLTRGSIKRRYGFAYNTMTDSAGHTDTSAYNIRFDANTVGNPSVTSPYCRQLLKTAIHDWACNLQIRYRIGRDTVIANDTAGNGISYVTFKPTLSNSNFVAETNLTPIQCTMSVNYFSSEADVSFKSGVSWSYINPSHIPIDNPDTLASSGIDFFSVALHEFGHVSLLLHVNQTNDLMYYSLPLSGPLGPYISTDDYSGGVDNVIYSKSLNFSSCPVTGAITLPSTSSGACADPSSGQVGIQKFNTNTQLSVYPNPASDVLNVTFVKQKESSNTIKLVNALGQTVFYRNIGKNEGANEPINTSSLAKGVYVLVVTDDSNTITKKIIVE